MVKERRWEGRERRGSVLMTEASGQGRILSDGDSDMISSSAL